MKIQKMAANLKFGQKLAIPRDSHKPFFCDACSLCMWTSREIVNSWPNFKFVAIFWTFSHNTSDKSKNCRKKWHVGTKYPQNGIFWFWICYNSKTTLPRVNILPSMDFLGSNNPTMNFSSRNSKFSNFGPLAFFLPIFFKISIVWVTWR